MDSNNKHTRQGIFITVDANIGAGKSNACHAICSAASASGYPARVLEEPTSHPKFAYFVSKYYSDLRSGKNTGGGFGMQMFMLCKRYEQHRLAVELSWGEQGIAVIQDRPIYGDTVFATTAMECGFMTKEEYELYVEVFRNMSRDVMPPDIFIYLDVPPEVCYKRMARRSRSEEEGVPLDYLQHLDRNYKLLIQEMRRRGVRVLIIDWQEFGPPVEIWNQILKMVGSVDNWYEQLTFSFAKHSSMPIVDAEEPVQPLK